MDLFKSSIFKTIAPLCMIICLTGMHLKAQNFNSSPVGSGEAGSWSVNLSGGSSIFFGDIKQYKIVPVSNYENEWRFGGALQLGYQASPVLGLRFQGLYAQLAGTRRPSNRYFESSYIEINLNGTLSLRNIFGSFNPRQMWDVYFILGVGITNYNTELMELSTKKVIRKVGYGHGVGFGGRTMEGILVGGMGLKIRLSDKWDLNLESANRGMNSDRMDGKESGFKYDIYNYSSLGVTFKFGRKRSAQFRESNQEYSYFESRKKNVNERPVVTPVKDQPVQPAEIDMLFVAPPILSQPVEPPKEVKAEKETPVVVVLEEEPYQAPQEKPMVQGIEYRVQIRAKYGNAISIDKLSNMYHLPASQIRQNTHNGFYIYTVGSYATYEAARERRNELRSYNGIVDAFVVAFKNGERLDKLP